MRVALDTNVLVYAEGVNGAAMQDSALDLIERLPRESAVVPVQALGELFHVLVRKAKRRRTAVRASVLAWSDAYSTCGTSPSVLLSAMELASTHGLAIWDAVVLAAAADAGCRLLLSEDLQEGFTWQGVTVTNPFATKRHPLLAAILQSPEQI